MWFRLIIVIKKFYILTVDLRVKPQLAGDSIVIRQTPSGSAAERADGRDMLCLLHRAGVCATDIGGVGAWGIFSTDFSGSMWGLISTTVSTFSLRLCLAWR